MIIIKKRKIGALLSGTMVVLLSAVLVAGMASGAAPKMVFAEEKKQMREYSGKDWMLDATGKLMIESDAGMSDWMDSGRERHSKQVMSVKIQEGVTNIGEQAFLAYSKLTDITIPETVTSIGKSAFSGCSSLTNITIPNSVTSIGEKAFYNCTSLTDIAIPENVTIIESHTFYNCNSLKNVGIPFGVTNIKMHAFEKCSSLISVTIPDSVTIIDYTVFRDCSSLVSVTIPSGVTSIDMCMFQDCSSLTSITIPKNVTRIGRSAFEGCHNLTNVTILSEKPQWLGDNVFEGCKFMTDGTKGLHVPEGTEETYKTKWSDLADYIIGDSSDNGGYNLAKSQKQDDEPKTGDNTLFELYAVLAMIAGFICLCLRQSSFRWCIATASAKNLQGME